MSSTERKGRSKCESQKTDQASGSSSSPTVRSQVTDKRS